MSSFNWPGYSTLQARLGRLINLDATPLMIEWENTITEDNRRGVLAGIDGYGHPMAPLAPSTIKHRKGTGPPLAPMGAASRVIANFRTAYGRDGEKWVAFGAWENVLSKRGIPFLPFHFQGRPALNLPRRDLAHIRAEGHRQARLELRTFVRNILRGP